MSAQVTAGHIRGAFQRYVELGAAATSMLGESYETVLNYIRTTTTKTGLRVQSTLIDKDYETGVKITDKQMASLAIEYCPTLPAWNYTIRPS